MKAPAFAASIVLRYKEDCSLFLVLHMQKCDYYGIAPVIIQKGSVILGVLGCICVLTL